MKRAYLTTPLRDLIPRNDIAVTLGDAMLCHVARAPVQTEADAYHALCAAAEHFVLTAPSARFKTLTFGQYLAQLVADEPEHPIQRRLQDAAVHFIIKQSRFANEYADWLGVFHTAGWGGRALWFNIEGMRDRMAMGDRPVIGRSYDWTLEQLDNQRANLEKLPTWADPDGAMPDMTGDAPR